MPTGATAGPSTPPGTNTWHYIVAQDDHIEVEVDNSEMGTNTIWDPEEIDELLRRHPDAKEIDLDLDLTSM